MNSAHERLQQLTRRHLFGRAAAGIGAAALGSLLGSDAQAAETIPGLPHFAPKATRVIYLFQSGGPSQMELFDYKPRLVDKYEAGEFDEDARTVVLIRTFGSDTPLGRVGQPKTRRRLRAARLGRG